MVVPRDVSPGGHAWYQLLIKRPNGRARGLALVECRDQVHARQLGIDLGAEHHELIVRKLPPDPKRPLTKRFRECPHCRWLKENGF